MFTYEEIKEMENERIEQLKKEDNLTSEFFIHINGFKSKNIYNINEKILRYKKTQNNSCVLKR